MNPKIKRTFAAGMAGNALEFYDFSIYAFFAVHLGAVFFPSQDPIIESLKSWGIFAVGFVMRPIGGILFGHIGDKYGRRRALMLCVTFMAVPTFVIGLLPGYNEIGIWAPVALLLCRLLQGLSTGGEYNGAAIFVVEHANPSLKGFAGSLITSSSYIGWFLAAIVSYPFITMAEVTWAWRVPFLFGLIIGLIGLYLRKKVSETPEFLEYMERERPRQAPLFTALKENARAVFATFGIAAFSGVIAYTTLAFISFYLEMFLGWSKQSAVLVTMLGSLIYAAVSPVVGWLVSSRSFDPRRVCLWAIGAVVLSAYPVFFLVNTGSLIAILMGQLIWALVTIVYQAPMNILMSDLFPVEARYRGIGFGYSMGMAAFGGTSPLVLTWLTKETHNFFSPVVWIACVGLLGFVAIYYARPQISARSKI